jgi:hypothetical protein
MNGNERFKKELSELLNRYCIDNQCDIPDFILSEIICGIIDSIGIQFKKALDWHGTDSVCHPKKKEVKDAKD